MKKFSRSELVNLREPTPVVVKNIRQQSKMVFGKFVRPNDTIVVTRTGMDWIGIPDIEGLEVSLYEEKKPEVRIVNPIMLKSEREARLVTGKKTLAEPADIVRDVPKASTVTPPAPLTPAVPKVTEAPADPKAKGDTTHNEPTKGSGDANSETSGADSEASGKKDGAAEGKIAGGKKDKSGEFKVDDGSKKRGRKAKAAVPKVE